MDDILGRYNQCYQDSWQHFARWYEESQTDLQFYSGVQWSQREAAFLAKQGRNLLTVNQIRPQIDMITGYQRKHRHSSVVTPVEDRDQETADLFTKLGLQVFQSGDVYTTISDAFETACIRGLAFLHPYIDYSEDPLHGRICVEELPSGSVVFDRFRKKDMSDCGHFIRRSYLPKDDLKVWLPKSSQKIDHLRGDFMDEKFEQLREHRHRKDIVAVDEFWTKELYPARLLIDQETGEYEVWTRNFDKIRQYLDLAGKQNVLVKPWRQAGVRMHLIANGQVLTSFKNPGGLKRFPFVPVFGIFQPDCKTGEHQFQGIVRQMRDSQRDGNKRRSQFMDIQETSINSGFMFEEGAISDPEILLQSGQGKLVQVRQGYYGRIQQLSPPNLPPTMLEFLRQPDQDMMSVSGCSEAMMGLDDNQETAGVAVLLRQGAGLIKLQGLMDNLRQSQKLLTEICMRYMQTWTPDKIERLVGVTPGEEFYRHDIKLDVSVQEGVLTDSQRQLYFRQLVELNNLTGGAIPATELLKEAPIQGRRELLKKMQQMEENVSKKAAEEEQRNADKDVAAAKLLESQAYSELASVREKQARALSLVAQEEERTANAAAKREDTVLEKLKVLHELEGLRPGIVAKYLGLADQLERREQAQEKNSQETHRMVLESMNEGVSGEAGENAVPPPPE